MLPRLDVVRRLRPFDLLAPGDVRVTTDSGGLVPMPAVAPYVTTTAAVRDRCALGLQLADHRIGASLDDGSVSLTISRGRDTEEVRSRRFHRAADPTELALTLTGAHATAWTREQDAWVARARYDLRDARSADVPLDIRDEATLADLHVELPDWGGTAGGFGQLGLRDVRFVTEEDGRPLRDGDRLWLTATSAGPGFFDTAHTSVWRLDLESLDVAHTADVFFRRPDTPGVFGDHATHIVRTTDGWVVATSTWGDFETPTTRAGRRTPSGLRVTLAELPAEADPLCGSHVLDTRELTLPTDGLTSVATWDPHLVRRDGGWLVGFVSARRFFDFHPALAQGPSLDDLHLRGAAADRTATEGTTLVEVDGRMLVLASDGRDSRRAHQARFPVFDLEMSDVGLLDAPYPTNLPWPSLVQVDGSWLMVTFNGAAVGGTLLGYGTHGDLVVMRSQ